MVGRRRGVIAAWVLATSMLAGQPAAVGAPQASADLLCRDLPGLVPNLWLGIAGDDWFNVANWALGVLPVRLDSYACIPPGGAARIKPGREVQLAAVDVVEGGELTVSDAELFVNGDQDDQASSVRGALTVVSGFLGGPGRIDVSGTLSLVNSATSADAPTLTTRECAVGPPPYRADEEPCVPGVPIVGDTGLVVVGDDGVVDVRGDGASRIADQYRMIVRGLVRVREAGYLLADHGTRLELRPHSGYTAGVGTLRFEDDGDYLEGHNDFGIPALGTVVNQGLIHKTGGGGTSLVTGPYSQPAPGAVQVDTGTLLLPVGSAVPAGVAAGATYGTGRCLTSSAGCLAQTFAGDQQNGRFKVPEIDASGADVLVRELGTASSGADIGKPVEAHATGLDATRSHAATITLRYDERLLGGRGWPDVDVFRQAVGETEYVKLPPCLASGAPPVSSDACVDRRGLPASSRDVVDAEGPTGAPDVVMVVRTTATSRWVAR